MNNIIPDSQAGLQIETKGVHRILTLNRPEKRNALNPALVMALTRALADAETDSSIRTVTIAANGTVFCSGADLEMLQAIAGQSEVENRADSEAIANLFLSILRHPKPVFARIQGDAVAGGCGLATACDFSFAVTDSGFSYPEVKIGFVPAIVSVWLTRKIGDGRARDLLLTGRRLPATTAAEWGMITECVAADELDSLLENRRQAFEESISPESVRLTKEMLWRSLGLSLEAAVQTGAEINVLSRSTADCKEGILAFLEKRKPVFGR